MFVFTATRDVYQVGIHKKTTKLQYSVNDRKNHANFCFSSIIDVCQGYSSELGTPECQVGTCVYLANPEILEEGSLYDCRPSLSWTCDYLANLRFQGKGVYLIAVHLYHGCEVGLPILRSRGEGVYIWPLFIFIMEVWLPCQSWYLGEGSLYDHRSSLSWMRGYLANPEISGRGSQCDRRSSISWTCGYHVNPEISGGKSLQDHHTSLSWKNSPIHTT